MAGEFSTLDIVAVTNFFVVWVVYQALFDGRWRRRTSINAALASLRRHWMRALLVRENRIVDSTLVGHVIHSASFFASTTMFVVAGLIGVLGSADRIYAAIGNITLLLGGGQRLFEWKVVLLIAIFIYAFFKFTWALRQFNYFSAVVGSAPDARRESIDVDAYAERMAAVLTYAVGELNAGVRAYYFAFAAFGWFIDPRVFIVATVLMVLVIARRQLVSPTAKALREHGKCLDDRREGVADDYREGVADDRR
ncbi:MAG: DUF599 family protein [Rhodospirillales bacterium]|nr:DUF599 family protein [Rhodospirillales bacterium]